MLALVDRVNTIPSCPCPTRPHFGQHSAPTPTHLRPPLRHHPPTYCCARSPATTPPPPPLAHRSKTLTAAAQRRTDLSPVHDRTSDTTGPPAACVAAVVAVGPPTTHVATVSRSRCHRPALSHRRRHVLHPSPLIDRFF
jgi:hypothetical protein